MEGLPYLPHPEWNTPLVWGKHRETYKCLMFVAGDHSSICSLFLSHSRWGGDNDWPSCSACVCIKQFSNVTYILHARWSVLDTTDSEESQGRPLTCCRDCITSWPVVLTAMSEQSVTSITICKGLKLKTKARTEVDYGRVMKIAITVILTTIHWSRGLKQAYSFLANEFSLSLYKLIVRTALISHILLE